MKRYAIRTAVAAALALATLCVAWLVAAFPEAATAAARPFSRLCMAVVGAVTSLLPFSLAEFLIYALILAVPALIVWTIVQCIREKSAVFAARVGSIMAMVCACVFAFFMLGWGLNYNTLSVADDMGLSVETYTIEQLETLGMHIVQQINDHADTVPRDASGAPDFGGFYAMRRLLGDNRAKPMAASRLMSYTYITGIFMPLTAEANVNADQPDISIPFTMAHELAHAQGYAREDEANFIAYLTCRESDSASVRYSGYISIYIYVSNALSNAGFDGYMAWVRMYDAMCETAKNDLDMRSDYWSQFRGTVADLAMAINDTYIKAMDDSEPTAAVEVLAVAASDFYEAGSRRYGAVVDLLLAEFYRD